MPVRPNDAPLTHAPPGPDPASAADPARDAERELAFRRSLRSSRARRVTAALRRRRTLRGRRTLLGAAAGLVVLSAGAFAAAGGGVGGAGSSASGLSERTVKAAQRALGVTADGVVGPQTRKATRRFQRTNSLQVDGILGPRTLKALGVAVRVRSAPVAAAPGQAAILQRIAQCESGGDPTAISADGRYHGKYQFSRPTWRSVGGKGSPSAAPEAEQDRRAATLLRRSGTAPWPNCA